jgi:hypothetical protein
MSFIDRELIGVIREPFSLDLTGIHGVRGTGRG